MAWKSKFEKEAAVRRVQALMDAGGLSQNQACAQAGVSVANFVRWSTAMQTAGLDGLAPAKPTGRPRSFDLTEEETHALRGLTATFDSVRYAIEQFPRHEACGPQTREKILEILDRAARAGREPHFPRALCRAAFVTADEKARLRGQRHAQAREFTPRKGMWFEGPDGEQIPILAHTAWMMDDYSTNEPYIVGAEDGTMRLCRQYLMSLDVYSGAWIGSEAIGRERDAYRGEDILRFILRNIDGQGTMPRFLLLERGRWDSQAVHGLPLTADHDGPRWGGLDDLIHIIHGYTPRHKAALESNLSMLQRALAHSGREIGRHRGEFEDATKAYLAVQAGRLDPHKAGFLSLADSSELHWQACQQLNARPKARVNFEHQTVPNDLLQQAEAPRPLAAEERWRFFPAKMTGTVRGGFVEKSLPHWPRMFRFQVNGVLDGLYLDNGYAVLVAFDPAQPHLGAMIANAETGTRNRAGWALGQNLILAPVATEVPQFTLRSGGAAEGSKRKANATARTSFAAVRPHVRGMRVAASFDGEGRSATIQTGTAPASCVAPAEVIQGAAVIRPGRGVTPAAPPARRAVRDLNNMSRAELIAALARAQETEEALH
jgi:hypothetical protein